MESKQKVAKSGLKDVVGKLNKRTEIQVGVG